MLSSSVVSLIKLDQGCFSPQNLWTVDHDLLKALWENVPEQTLQEISDAIWGQVSLFFCQLQIFKTTFTEVFFFPGWFGPSLVKQRLCVTSRTRRRFATRRGWAYRLFGCSTLVPLQVVSDHVHVLPSGLQDHGTTDQRREERG